MARARNGNQRGTPTGPFGRGRDRVLKTAGRPTPRTGGGMKLPTKRVRPPKPTDAVGRVMPKKFTSVPKGEKAPRVAGIAGRKIVEPKPTKKVRPPKPTDTGGRVIPKKKRPPRSGGDGLTPVRRKQAMSRRRTSEARARAGNRRRRGLR